MSKPSSIPPRKAIRKLSRAAAYLAQTADGDRSRLEASADLLRRAQRMDALTQVPVYRRFQDLWESPCKDPLNGKEPCEACRSGKGRDCSMLRRAEPAFTLPTSGALELIKAGLAKFIDCNRAIQLLFSEVAGIRGKSTRVDEMVLAAYADGDRWARVLIDMGWYPTAAPVGLEQAFPLGAGEFRL